MKLVCISDTHCQHNKIDLPEGDILIHSGDISYRGEKHEIENFAKWFVEQPFEHKILVAGNHDWMFEKDPEQAQKILDNAGDIIYLNDSGIEINGIKFWGSPVQPEFCNWAFNRKRGKEINEHWLKIPEDTDVLITHGPPMGILDSTHMTRGPVGCSDLFDHIMKRVKPQYHIFGHIHEGHGTKEFNGVKFVNASLLTDYYNFEYEPIVVDIDGDK